MKRPKNIKILYIADNYEGDTIAAKGYNFANEKWEKFLPSEDEILKIIVALRRESLISVVPVITRKLIAKAISKRLGNINGGNDEKISRN